MKEKTVGGLGKHPPDNFIMNEALNSYAVVRGMVITTEQIGTEVDQNRVVYFDLPLSQAVRPVFPKKEGKRQ